jgi:hypothetical protein
MPILAESNEIRSNVTGITETVHQIDQIISKLPPLLTSQSVMHIRGSTWPEAPGSAVRHGMCRRRTKG